MKLQRKSVMLSDVEKGNTLMLTKLTPVAKLAARSISDALLLTSEICWCVTFAFNVPIPNSALHSVTKMCLLVY